MSLGVLNNIAAIYAENNLNSTQGSLQTVLEQLSSGSRINSGADDAAGLSLADGLGANSAALNQSALNASRAWACCRSPMAPCRRSTTCLTRGITLATEASNGTLNTTQDAAANQEYQSILDEITNIGTTTTYNGQAGLRRAPPSIYTGDASAAGSATDGLTIAPLATATVGDARRHSYLCGRSYDLHSRNAGER